MLLVCVAACVLLRVLLVRCALACGVKFAKVAVAMVTGYIHCLDVTLRASFSCWVAHGVLFGCVAVLFVAHYRVSCERFIRSHSLCWL